MVGKTAPIRRQDELRFKVITEYCGCLPCLLENVALNSEDLSLTTIEHVTEHGRRLPDEHQATIGLCPWHHQAIPWNGLNERDMQAILGPSLAKGRKPFEERYGDEVMVLLPLQDILIIQFAQDPWPEYTVPESVRKSVWKQWIKMRSKS